MFVLFVINSGYIPYHVSCFVIRTDALTNSHDQIKRNIFKRFVNYKRTRFVNYKRTKKIPLDSVISFYDLLLNVDYFSKINKIQS
jgi:hypothetical protein